MGDKVAMRRLIATVLCSVLVLFAVQHAAEARQPAAVRSHYFNSLVKAFEKHSGSKYWNFEKRRETTAGMIQEAGMDYGGEDMKVEAGRFVALAQNLIGDDDVDGKWYAREIRKTIIRE